MVTQSHTRLRIESLEARDVPATFGVPWADPLHITASFTPDGTIVQSGSGGLLSTLKTAKFDPSNMPVLLALQQWINAANVNVGIVADSGQMFGTGGAIQGDPRFGDIRIGTTAMTSLKLAETQPYDAAAGTWAGDILLNASNLYNLGLTGSIYDTYTVFLQEFGHALGLPNSTDTSSVMFDYYTGTRTGLSSIDIAAIQALYGLHAQDEFDLKAPNNTFDTATFINMLSSWGKPIATAVSGDLTTKTDLDYYTFTAAQSGWTTITVKADGLSLLTSRLDVYSSTKSAVAMVETLDPLKNTISVRFLAEAGKNYFVSVQAANTAFSVGAYELQLVPEGLTLANNDTLGYMKEFMPGLNDSIKSATSIAMLSQMIGTDERYDYAANAAIDTNTDNDYFKFTVPADIPSSYVLNVTAWSLENNNLRPQLTLYDAAGAVVPSEVVVNDTGEYTLQAVGPWTAGATYYARVQSQGGTTAGRYFLGIDFNKNMAGLTTLQASTNLNKATAKVQGTLVATEDGLNLFTLNNTGDTNTGVTLSIYNSSGSLVLTFSAFGTETVTDHVWLQMGTYNVVYTTATRDGATFGKATFVAKYKNLSDSIDPYQLDPNAPKTSTSTSTSTSTTSTSTYRSSSRTY